ncbi:hypothetical protein ACFE04_015552 [Oxalis oulophora]
MKTLGMFSSMKKSKNFNGRVDQKNPDELEIRPGGMLVQKRDSNNISLPLQIPTIRVKVKYGFSYHEIRISSQASFGELKKMLSVHTGLHPEEQKLMYKNKERDSKAFLDVSRVKDGSKIVLVEDTASRERRRLEMLKNANIEKASKLISRIGLELDKLGPQVTALEKAASDRRKVKENDVDNLTGTLMTNLVELDSLIVDGELKSQKRMQERRAQQCIETLDKLRLEISEAIRNKRNTSLQQQENSISQKPGVRKLKQRVQLKQKDLTEKSPVRNSNPFVVMTTWETFD